MRQTDLMNIWRCVVNSLRSFRNFQIHLHASLLGLSFKTIQSSSVYCVKKDFNLQCQAFFMSEPYFGPFCILFLL